MMQRFFSLLMAAALLLTTTACSASGAARTLDRAEDSIEQKLDAAEDKVEDAVRKAVPPAPAATPTFPAAVPTETAPAITREEARKIALDHLGFTADQVEHLRTENEIDDGIPQYDVEFHQGDWEYEFEISAETGKILTFDTDHKYD